MDSKLEITTERLKLRAYEPSDWERVHIYASIPEFSKYELWGPNKLEDTHNFISEMIAQAEYNPRYQFNFAVCLKENNLLIGGCGMRRETEYSRIANLGWAINPEFQSKGYATEAAKAMIEFGFKELKLAVIYATCDTRNTPSYKVMEKLGMSKVGIIKGTKEIKGHIRDSFRYELFHTI